MIQSPGFLRQVLWMDAASGAALMLLLLTVSGLLSVWLGLPAELLRVAGWIILAVVMLLIFVASQRPLSEVGIWLVVGINSLWILASLGLLLGNWVSPNALGYTFVVGQAVFVAVLTVLEYLGLRSIQLQI